MEPGGAVREEAGESVAVDRWLQTEAGEAAELRLADGKSVDVGVLGDGGDGVQTGGFDRSVSFRGIPGKRRRTNPQARTQQMSGPR
ncbi:hypothetical protein ACH4S8_34390 [Streptomyces sp. NPDC021080]|uniref:hypothetical protein n=1 Tax=Streptomyces sp. NPDC021080 TaxID=3365110 RepID=UPI003799940B